jgi:hypothetical protein
VYATLASLRGVVAWLAMNSPPVKTPGGNPVIDVPVAPISPWIVVGPVFVMAEKLRAPYVAAEPRFIYLRMSV